MPVKARYRSDPAKHRTESLLRRKRLTALGMRDRDRLSPAAQEKRDADKRKWTKEHRAANRIAQRKYRKKLIRLFGSCNSQAHWRYSMLLKERNALKRKKLAATILPHELVESGKRRYLLPSRKRLRRSPTRSRMVLRR